MKEIIKITKHCYENLEKIDVLVNVLHEKYLSDKDTVVILEILSSNIKNLTELILSIQNKTT